MSLHTMSGECGEKEAYKNWLLVIHVVKAAAPVTRTSLRTTGPVSEDSRQIMRDPPIKSGLTRWRSTVIDGRRRGKREESRDERPDSAWVCVMNERADAGRDGRTRLARPNSQARTGTGKKQFSTFIQLTTIRIANHNRWIYIILYFLLKKGLTINITHTYCLVKKNLNTHLDLLSIISQSGGKMSKCLGRVIGCK